MQLASPFQQGQILSVLKFQRLDEIGFSFFSACSWCQLICFVEITILVFFFCFYIVYQKGQVLHYPCYYFVCYIWLTLPNICHSISWVYITNIRFMNLWADFYLCIYFGCLNQAESFSLYSHVLVMIPGIVWATWTDSSLPQDCSYENYWRRVRFSCWIIF